MTLNFLDNLNAMTEEIHRGRPKDNWEGELYSAEKEFDAPDEMDEAKREAEEKILVLNHQERCFKIIEQALEKAKNEGRKTITKAEVLDEQCIDFLDAADRAYDAEMSK